MKVFRFYFYKSISYRILSIIVTFVISFILTGDFTMAGSIASIDAVIKFAMYFLHEQAWGHIFKKMKQKRKAQKKASKLKNESMSNSILSK